MHALFVAALAGAVSAPAAKSTQTVDVPVLNRTIERGEQISPADFSVETRAAGLARGATNVADAIGMEAARRLPAGTVVRPGDVVRPQIIHRGDQVIVALRSGSLSITTAGRALSAGGIGDPVRVVSLATNHTLDAVVESSGHVRIGAR